jgi:hypothetical protein
MWLAQVAGLDVGWHTLLDLQEHPMTKRLEVTREVLPGSYPFKFILDGHWCANFDYPTYQVRERGAWCAVYVLGSGLQLVPCHTTWLCGAATLPLRCRSITQPQDGSNVNNMITVLPRDALDNNIRERLLSATGA